MAMKWHLVLYLLTLNLCLLRALPNPDVKPLLAFKSGSDPSNKLTSWNTTTDLCTWYGVSCLQNRVSRLVLEGLGLTGSLEPLTALTELRVLSLKRNQFSGPIPNLSNFTALKLLFLSHNGFSGDFPTSITSLFRLFRLDLSNNDLSGDIPAEINRLTHLLTLRLEGNRFTGVISEMNLPNLQEFNVSGNKLAGEIPKSLAVFPESVFTGNNLLCGPPLAVCKSISADPTRPGSSTGAIAGNTVSSSPSSVPEINNNNNDAPINSRNHQHSGSGKISPLAIAAIIVGDVVVLALISLILYCYFWRNYAARKTQNGGGGGGGKSSRILEGEKIVYSSSPYPYPGSQPGFERGRMVFFEGARRFELEDLLRASAEMLGKGGFGTAYKAVLDDGNVVAVKRLKEANFAGRREFEQQMEVLGRLRHPNLVTLKAYYFARDEKLLVYDYMPNANLFWLLHGNRGPGRAPLDWTTRLKIAAGAARGISFIHSSCRSLRLTHGNIKSTNILLDKAGNACVSDFGLSMFSIQSSTQPRSNGYRAPESVLDPRKITQRSDVYSFGVLLLELLTGKCPSALDSLSGAGAGYGGGGAVDLPRWVQSVVREEWTAEVFDLELMRYKDIEEEMVGMLQIAMACTAASPDQRPKMSQVVKMIDEIRGIEFDSVSDSPSVSEDTGCASQ
ncbi:probable leucine-rich repeat receptor-like protein kinase At1g68400 [Impatiens glandulifera]|uniref:probable leucine-rich repeat receptor-like protein kinase At1g68400 n=1 Tax=Impatiens glandulifera TaxID=253017 RepID=UPI001FB0DA11|nr:probable leucine-rich repeat receptor-like protein kinase At1g68400 [Impatiens glandulifera]